MALLIRDVAQGDAEALVAILNPIIEARIYSAFAAPFTVDEERAFIARFPSRGVWKVAVRRADDQIVGMQILEPFGPYTTAFDHVATIGTFVALDQRRQGVATALFSATYQAARESGFEKLFAHVRADNSVALATYARQGFAVVGTAHRHAKIDGRYVDEVFIEKSLDPDQS
jgi:L-amino acid N-acyltransferase YncA